VSAVETPPILHAEDARVAVDDVVAIDHLTMASRGDRVLCVGEVEVLFAALTCVPLRARAQAMEDDDLPGEAHVVAGTLLVGGHDVATRAHLAVAGASPVNLPLPERMTTHEYVTWGARLGGIAERAAREMAAAALERVGLAGAMRSAAAALGPGQRRALGLANAVVADPKVIIAEAPLAGLDVHAAMFVMNAMAAVTQGRGAIFSVHRMEPGTPEGELAHGASHAVVIAGGAAVLEGAPAELFVGARIYGVTVRGNAGAFRQELEARGIAVRGGPMRMSAVLPEGGTTREILAAAKAARAPVVELFPIVGGVG
jgi:ABC-2 type transport system ATP-binding protein